MSISSAPIPVLAAEVIATQELTPCMRRIILGGEAIRRFEPDRAGQWVKLFLELQGAVINRAYTVRRFDPVLHRMEIDIVLHGHGGASGWAARAKPNDRLGLSGPRAGYHADADAGWLLLAGDETALPAILSILEIEPASRRILAYLEVADRTAEQAVFGSHQPIWVHRGTTPVGEKLLAMIEAASLPLDAGEAWIAGEAGLVRRLRRHLRNRPGLPAIRIRAKGYWTPGATDYREPRP